MKKQRRVPGPGGRASEILEAYFPEWSGTIRVREYGSVSWKAGQDEIVNSTILFKPKIPTEVDSILSSETTLPIAAREMTRAAIEYCQEREKEINEAFRLMYVIACGLKYTTFREDVARSRITGPNFAKGFLWYGPMFIGPYRAILNGIGQIDKRRKAEFLPSAPIWRPDIMVETLHKIFGEQTLIRDVYDLLFGIE